MARALALVSGGLDSILAAKLIKEQGIDVICICFHSAFFSYENAVRMTEQVGLPLKIVDFTEDHIEMVKKPKHGYGKNMNPCIDCHSMMMKYAGELLKELEADFIITGEVLNQRPMSQNKAALDVVKKESGFEEYILRPLCAKNLPPTKMEMEGVVDREKLLGINGRTRKVQMELAKEWNITEYPSPAGGCKLTDPGFSKRLKDLFTNNKDADLREIELLKYGRHFRLESGVKVVSTRDAEEANWVKPLINNDDYIFDTIDYPGSTIILKGSPNEKDIYFAASATGRYSKGRNEDIVRVKYKRLADEEYNTIEAKPASEEELNSYLL